MTKIDALNALNVEDYSCCENECEYVFTETTTENIKVLLDAGFTAEQIDEAMEDDKTSIDLSLLAFQYADANWWSQKEGFSVADESEATHD
ncbi:MAG TPA: hypothetical protein VN512_13095 [Clostridia bacterium]|nr:hypothetical protein [Clostridia bacterium]